MPPPIAPAARLRAELDRLAEATASARFALQSDLQSERIERRHSVVATIRDYLIPRLGDRDAPLLVAVVGPTGSGKSTLVNSIAGREVTRPGVLRPTTRHPVVWTHPDHRHRYARIGDVEAELVTDDHPLLGDLAVVDTPDLDSIAADHQRMALAVIGNADVVVFMTSAQRYADAVPWEVLIEADSRGSEMVFVLNRLSRRASGAVADYAALLRGRGFVSPRILTIQEQRLRGAEGSLPPRSIDKVMTEVRRLAADRESLTMAITRRVTAFVVDRSRAVASDVELQREEAAALGRVADGSYDDAFAEVRAELDRGALVRTEVVDRWSERIGTGEIARLVDGSVSRLRSLVEQLAGRGGATIDSLEREARTEIREAVEGRLERAGKSTLRAWSLDPAGRALIGPDLGVLSPETRDRLQAELEAWLAGLTRLVEEEAPGRFRTARITSTGLNAAAVSTILALFAATGGITGAEVGVAAGAAAAQQALLERMLGRAAARSLAGRARDDLLTRLASVFDLERHRFASLLAVATDPPELTVEIRRHAASVETESELFHAV